MQKPAPQQVVHAWPVGQLALLEQDVEVLAPHRKLPLPATFPNPFEHPALQLVCPLPVISKQPPLTTSDPDGQQAPLKQNGFPSLQAVPDGANDSNEQMPVLWSHVPATWHWLLAAGQVIPAPVHVPAWQVLFGAQASLLTQTVPSNFVGFEQTPVAGSHVPAT